MKNIILICMFLSLTSMDCSGGKILKCADCSDKESVLKAVSKITEKKLSDNIDNYEIKIEEETCSYTIVYTNCQYLNEPLKKGGGGFLITISKEKYKIVDYKQFK